jgi:hypothetical protein
MCHARPNRRLLAFLLPTVLMFAACQGSNSPTSPSGSSKLEIRMTDAPADAVSELDVHITGLNVKPKDGPVMKIADDLGPIDLLSLQGTSKLLATADVPPGDYEFVQVDLAADGSSVVESATELKVSLALASDEIKVLGGFTVAADQTTTVLLDFKASDSLRQEGNGTWLLTPVIVQASANVGGG